MTHQQARRDWKREFRECEEELFRVTKQRDDLVVALSAIAAMKDEPYYIVNPRKVADDAHLIAFGALASVEEGK